MLRCVAGNNIIRPFEGSWRFRLKRLVGLSKSECMLNYRLHSVTRSIEWSGYVKVLYNQRNNPEVPNPQYLGGVSLKFRIRR